MNRQIVSVETVFSKRVFIYLLQSSKCKCLLYAVNWRMIMFVVGRRFRQGIFIFLRQKLVLMKVFFSRYVSVNWCVGVSYLVSMVSLMRKFVANIKQKTVIMFKKFPVCLLLLMRVNFMFEEFGTVLGLCVEKLGEVLFNERMVLLVGWGEFELFLVFNVSSCFKIEESCLWSLSISCFIWRYFLL